MIHKHRSHHLARALAAGAAAAALTAPPAIARTDPPAVTAFDARNAGPKATVKSDSVSASAPVVVRTVDAGFDWGAAAIGAGGTGLLIALASLATFGNTSRHRTRAAS